MTLEFRLANDIYATQCFQLLGRLYQENYYGISKEFLKWKYRTPFFNNLVKQGEHPIMVAVEHNKVMAFEAFLPMATSVSGNLYTTIWTTEWMNNSRIAGLGRKVFSSLRQKAEFKCFYGANTFSHKSCRKDGMDISDQIERMLAFLNPDVCIDLFSGGKQRRAEFIESNASIPTSHKYCASPTCSNFSERYWEEAQSRFFATSYRGLDYLKWRYVDCPGIKYHFVSLDKRAQQGLAVLRIERIKGRRESVLRILDMLPTPGFENDLTQAVINFGKDHQAILADFFCASSNYARQILPKYFLPIGQHIEYDIPMLFQPIEVRERKSINMVLDASKSSLDIRFHNFYTSKADAEQDVFLNPDYTTPIL